MLKKLRNTMIAMLLVLSHAACVVVAYDYRDMLCGIDHCGYSAPAWVAFLKLIPFVPGMILCAVLAVVFYKKCKE